jgi:hypothetical protein
LGVGFLGHEEQEIVVHYVGKDFHKKLRLWYSRFLCCWTMGWYLSMDKNGEQGVFNPISLINVIKVY